MKTYTPPYDSFVYVWNSLRLYVFNMGGETADGASKRTFVNYLRNDIDTHMGRQGMYSVGGQLAFLDEPGRERGLTFISLLRTSAIRH